MQLELESQQKRVGVAELKAKQAESDLRRLIERRPAVQTLHSSRVVYLQTARPLPFLAFWTGRPPDRFSTAPPGPPTDSALIAARSDTAASYLTGKGPLPASGAVPPPGYRRVLSSASWMLYGG